MNTMAEVLAAHQLAVAWENEFSQGITCLCGLDIPLEKVRGEIDMDFLAAHQADALAEAGYGKLENVWDAGYMRGQHPWTKESQEVDPIPDYLSPPMTGRNANPYRSAS